jgi:hypothetical protein
VCQAFTVIDLKISLFLCFQRSNHSKHLENKMSAPSPPPGGTPGGPPGGFSPAQAASQAAKALVDWQEQMTAAYYAASILALLAIFSISHLIDRFLESHRSKTSSGITKSFVSISRYVPSSGLRKGLMKRGK